MYHGQKLKLRVFSYVTILRKLGLDPDEANELAERIMNTASINIISRLESKIDSQNSKYNFLIVIASVALTVGLAVGGWLLATGGS
ncbi:MAG: hypothetical protein OXF06_03955 [Bacteroidetes bacterium]|nr:hypothetical protein [Bacteroidota bacterium]